MAVQAEIHQIQAELGNIQQTLIRLQDTMEALVQTVSQRVQMPSPHIVRIPGVCGGRPVVAGTRISVRTIVERTRLGDSPEQIITDFPPLTLTQVYAALSYYHEHSDAIEAEITANQEALAWVTTRN